MRTVLSRPDRHRWLFAVVLGVITPLLFAALAGTFPGTGAEGMEPARSVGNTIAAPLAVRVDPLQPCLAEHDVLSERSAAARDEAAASLDSIDAVLGRLATPDEALLRGSLLSVREAGASVMSRLGGQSTERLTRSARRFSERLAIVAIPDGTRAALAANLIAYQHAVLSTQCGPLTTRETMGL